MKQNTAVQPDKQKRRLEKIRDKKEKLTLSGNVEILGLDKFGNRTFISTELLEIDPINETLKTDRRVNYESNNIHHSSVGMFANLNEDEIRFEKNVRGFYEKINN